MTTHGDPVAAISEADAVGEIAELYADIRATLGVPVVNLIWRHLAALPGGLTWAWGMLRPLYIDGCVTAEALALRQRLAVPALAGLTARDLARFNYSAGDFETIDLVLQSYERSNAMNLLSIAALLAHLEGHTQNNGVAGISEGREHAIVGDMPILLTLDEMQPDLRRLVADINAIGGRSEILASMYRHLAHWPEFLQAVFDMLTPFGQSDQLELLIETALSESRHRGVGLAAGLGKPSVVLTADTEQKARAALETFSHGPLCKMVAIVALIRNAMQQQE